MRLCKGNYQINDDDPFSSDLLNRKPFAENIIQLVRSFDDSPTIAISGRYGSGKSTFLEMLAAEMRKGDFEVMFFNAWESDYIEEPLSALVAEFSNFLPKTKSNEKLKEAGKTILKTGIPAAVKALTMNLVDLGPATEQVISEITSQIASDQLKKHLELKKSITTFKTQLAGIVDGYLRKGKKLVIIIDELDRCKPLFGIKVLEVVKHLFEVDGLSFIFALDYSQLSVSVQHVYGYSENISGYLKRFFDIQFQLPNPDIEKYIEYQFLSYGLNEELEQRRESHRQDHHELENLTNAMGIFAKLYSSSLRDLDRIFTSLVLVCGTTDNNSLIFPDVLAFLLFLYHFDRAFYDEVVAYEVSAKEIYEHFTQNDAGVNLVFDRYSQKGTSLLGELIVAVHDIDRREPNLSFLDEEIERRSGDENHAKVIERIKSIVGFYMERHRFGRVLECNPPVSDRGQK